MRVGEVKNYRELLVSMVGCHQVMDTKIFVGKGKISVPLQKTIDQKLKKFRSLRR